MPSAGLAIYHYMVQKTAKSTKTSLGKYQSSTISEDRQDRKMV